MAINQDTFSLQTPNSDDAASQVWQIDDPAGTPAFVDETADYNSVGAGDVLPFPASEAVGDQFAIGFTSTFGGVNIDVGTAGTAGSLTWKYWNGTAWTNLAGVTDDTTGFTVTTPNDVTWTVPTDWATRTLNGSAALYYVVAEVAVVYTINPILDQGFILSGFTPNPQVNLAYIATELQFHLRTGTGPVEVSFDGDLPHLVLDSTERVTVIRERTSRNVMWLRSVAGTEAVEVHAWA